MRRFALPLMLLVMMLFGCGAATHDESTGAAIAGSPLGAQADAFNPFLQSKLPNTRIPTSDGQAMLGAMGGKGQSIEEEARHRKHWRNEVYPVVFGDTKAPNEVIVVLDFANPASEKAWQAVTAAAKDMSPSRCKIVVFGRSSETYGTDLMGMTVYLTHARPGQAMPWLTYALNRWNVAKAAQKQAGTVKKFANEYDAVASPKDLPIPFGYYSRLNPPVTANQELALSRYCYDAGNVNMYQANQVCQYYGVSSLPAVIVNGKILGKISAGSILAAVK